MAKSKVPDVRAWAKSVKSTHTGKGGLIERMPDVRDAVDEVAKMRVKGETQATAKALFGFLVDEFGFSGSETALRNYLRRRTKWYTVKETA